MRYAALLLGVIGVLAVALAVTVQAGESEPASEPETTTEAEVTPEPTPATYKTVLPGLAADYAPERCSANVPDPSTLPVTQVTVARSDGERSPRLARCSATPRTEPPRRCCTW